MEPGIEEHPPVPVYLPVPGKRWSTPLTLSILDGPTLLLWSTVEVTQGRTKEELKLQLQPHESLVIGRQEGGEIDYLDPAYQPTRMLPNASQLVVTSFGNASDRCVSRGHFMLKGSLAGIVLTNGVPQRGGGIRPPMNGTFLLEPGYCQMADGEEYLITRGASAKIRLPNSTAILLCAE